MMNNACMVRKIPPFMKELEETYNICFSGMNTIERCIFGKKVVRQINSKYIETYQLCIVHYQLCNKEKIYKISYIQDDLELCNSFFDRESKMYISNDGEIGCLFCNNENKLRIDLFKNETNSGQFFLTCMNSVLINDIHKTFFIYESFCSFNSNNSLLIYSAESDDIKLKKENNLLRKKDIDMLKKINNGFYTENFGEQYNYSFFYLYVYNLVDNSIKYITVKDVSACYYSPHFIDDTSFVCLAYKTVPYRLGIYAFNTRPNDLYLCTLNDVDLEPLKVSSNCSSNNVTNIRNRTNRKSHIRCAYLKLSGKNFKHTCSPMVIKSDDNSIVYIACLVVFTKNEECLQHITQYNLVLIKLIKEDIKQKYVKSNNNFTKDIYEDFYENESCRSGEHSSKENNNGCRAELSAGGSYHSNVVMSNVDMMNIIVPNAAVPCAVSTAGPNDSNNCGSSRDDLCNYKKVETDVLIKEGQHTPFFRGLYTNEIKGYCYPYIFLNSIFYSNRIVIAVHMFTKKLFRIYIDKIYNEYDINTSVEILTMKNDNLFLSIKNMLLNDVLVYCIFDESNIKDDFIYLTYLKSYNIDFSTYDTIKKEKSIIYSCMNDNSKKLFMMLSEMETSLFKGKHPYIRRKNASFNLLYEEEKDYIHDIEQKGLNLPNFNLFNSKKLRNLILYIHGGPYSITINEYKNVFIFFAACGFDILCINYIGSLTISDKDNILNGCVNSIEIDDIIENFKDFYNCFSDYENVYLYGGSYGGFAACSILTKYNIFKSCCVINGVYEWILSAYSSDVTHYFLNMSVNKYCEYDCYFNKNEYAQTYELSPLNFVHNISTPILIICSKNDMRVSYHNSLSLYNRLRALKKKSKLFLFDDCNHSIDNYSCEETMLINIILWFYDYEDKKRK
ncbi:peptidase, putative [Plasmodium malariae]|uniref:Peptidase, putative n=1 Tax=Plasmodium malariae TaxID=5858 RepID=A0A1C3KYD7_PLAMA|nr:peptidase, putative [Plasmodium malariae]